MALRSLEMEPTSNLRKKLGVSLNEARWAAAVLPSFGMVVNLDEHDRRKRVMLARMCLVWAGPLFVELMRAVACKASDSTQMLSPNSFAIVRPR